MMRSMAAAVAAALALSSAVCVRAQLTELNLFEIIALPQYRNEFTILNSMIDKWFDGGADASAITDCETPFVFFAPTDEAWGNSWVGVNANTLGVNQVVDYFAMPDVLTYHILTANVKTGEDAGGLDRNSLLPPTNEGVDYFTLNGSPVTLLRASSDSNTLFPEVKGGFEGNIVALDSSVATVNGCAGSTIFFITDTTLYPPGLNITNEVNANNAEWLPSPGGLSLFQAVGTQQTDLFTDDANGNTRGLPVCTSGGARVPFADCTPGPISEVLGFCPALAYDGNAARDPAGQEMSSGFQSQYRGEVQFGTIDIAQISPTCPTAQDAQYGPFGISYSLTLLDYCDLIPFIDDDSQDLTLFLPTNEGWLKALNSAIPPVSPNALFAQPYSTWICDLIRYHAVPEKLEYFGDFEDGSSLPTLAGDGEEVFVRRQGLQTKINQSLVSLFTGQSESTVVYRIDYPLNPTTGPSFFPDFPGSTNGAPTAAP